MSVSLRHRPPRPIVTPGALCARWVVIVSVLLAAGCHRAEATPTPAARSVVDGRDDGITRIAHARSLRAAGQHPTDAPAVIPSVSPAAHTPTVQPAVAPRAARPVPSEVTARVHRVVLDPGHGGSDPGAIGPSGLTESSVNLDVARRVADRLATRHGVQVVLTRDADVYVPLEDRAAHANAAGADLFVSIHCNSAPNTEARGISTYILDTTSDRVAARVTAREGELVADDPVGSPDLPRILAGLRLARQGSRSAMLALDLQAAMLHDARIFYPDAVDAGVHPASFHVLVTARMPAALVELSFISNPAEEQRLRSDSYRDLLASAIARGVAGFTVGPRSP